MSDNPSLEQLLNTEHEVVWGRCEEVSALVRRVTANNPGKFTFKGTGTYIVGRGKVAIIDPGPPDSQHIQAVLNAVAGEEVTHILITHTHRDHSPGAATLAEATGATTFGYGPHPADPQDYPYGFSTAEEGADSKEREGDNTGGNNTGGNNKEDSKNSDTENTEKSGDTDFIPDEILQHGDSIGSDSWTVQCLHTPGHISNHLCFALEQDSSLFTGDHIMGWSSTIIPPPHGNLAAYLDSLRLLLARQDDTYYPTHGPAVKKTSKFYPQNFVQAILKHRQNRTAQILSHLETGPMTIPQLVAEMYSDKPKELHKPATQSVLAHLIFLLETGAVRHQQPADDTAQPVWELA